MSKVIIDNQEISIQKEDEDWLSARVDVDQCGGGCITLKNCGEDKITFATDHGELDCAIKLLQYAKKRLAE